MATDGKVSGTPKYLIGTVTKRTGLSADVVRVWERRYGAVRPARSDGGTRLYSDADILRLRRLREVIEKGHSIGQAARLTEGELDELIADAHQSVDGADPFRAVRDQFIEAVRDMDVVAADRELARAATLFPTRDLVKNIVEPLLRELGERRSHGELSVAHAQLASELLRNLLGSLFRLYPTSANPDTMVLATPVSERHDLALLLAALLAATNGWQAVYLGADVPPADIAHAVRLTNARVLVIWLATNHPHIGEQLRAIAHSVSPPTVVWIGGAAAIEHRDLIDHADWVLLRDLDDLNDRLRR